MTALGCGLMAVVVAVIVRRCSRAAPMPRRVVRGAYWSALWGALFGAPWAPFVAGLAALVAVALAVRPGSQRVRGPHVFLPQELRLRTVLAGVAAACSVVFLFLLGPARSWTARISRPDEFDWHELPRGNELWEVLAMGLVLIAAAYLCLRKLRGVSDRDAAVEGANIVVRTLLVVFTIAAGGLSTAILLRTDTMTMPLLGVPSLIIAVWALTTRPHGLRIADARRRLEQQRQDAETVPG